MRWSGVWDVLGFVLSSRVLLNKTPKTQRELGVGVSLLSLFLITGSNPGSKAQDWWSQIQTSALSIFLRHLSLSFLAPATYLQGKQADMKQRSGRAFRCEPSLFPSSEPPWGKRRCSGEVLFGGNSSLSTADLCSNPL